MPLSLENTYAEQLEGTYTKLRPAGFPKPTLLLFNHELAQDLGLPQLEESEAAELFSGTNLPAEWTPLAQAYAGHQFGSFNPQLGDGRALLLGEWVDDAGHRVDLHLKGSGPTPYSRGGDGRAGLGPMLREYLVGEAMHHLGVSTTRILAVVLTGEHVARQQGVTPGAVLARVASSHLRVGTLQLFASRNQLSLLRRVVSYALERHYPEHAHAENPALTLLQQVALRQARLVAQWMTVGFIHGVMNTDNVALSGETIDYGPCAFMDAYDPNTVFSSIDHMGRYAYGNQPPIAQWNLARMGEALLPLLDDDQGRAVDMVRGVLDRFVDNYEAAFFGGMAKKLGIEVSSEVDRELIAQLLDWMRATEQDWTLTFRRLAEGLRQGSVPFEDAEFRAWHERWMGRLNPPDLPRVSAGMDVVNPLYVPRNHLVEAALEGAVEGEPTDFQRLVSLLRRPFEEQAGAESYAEPAPPDFGPYQTFCGT